MILHNCPVLGCAILRLPPNRLMCAQHWDMVPAPLQKTIWLLWAEGTPRAGHAEACASAVAQVNTMIISRRAA